jgi:hypothetical protein
VATGHDFLYLTLILSAGGQSCLSLGDCMRFVDLHKFAFLTELTGSLRWPGGCQVGTRLLDARNNSRASRWRFGKLGLGGTFSPSSLILTSNTVTTNLFHLQHIPSLVLLRMSHTRGCLSGKALNHTSPQVGPLSSTRMRHRLGEQRSEMTNHISFSATST